MLSTLLSIMTYTSVSSVLWTSLELLCAANHLMPEILIQTGFEEDEVAATEVVRGAMEGGEGEEPRRDLNVLEDYEDVLTEVDDIASRTIVDRLVQEQDHRINDEESVEGEASAEVLPGNHDANASGEAPSVKKSIFLISYVEVSTQKITTIDVRKALCLFNRWIQGGSKDLKDSDLKIILSAESLRTWKVIVVG
jgi:hypothetical protein